MAHLKKDTNETMTYENELFTAATKTSKHPPSLLDFSKINTIIHNEIMIFLTDLNGVIIYANEKCTETLGYAPNELVGIHTRIFNAGTHTDEFYKELWETVLSGNVWSGEITVRRKDGTITWNSMSIFPIVDESNKPYQFLALRTDISAQKKYEKTALQKEKQLHSQFELANNVMGYLDELGNIIYVNQAYHRLLDYSMTQAIGTSIFTYIDPNDLEKAKRHVAEIVKNENSTSSCELNFKSKYGQLFTCEVTLKNLLHDPFIQAIVFHFHDITEQKKIALERNHWNYTDFLTGLPNRRYFENQLLKEINEALDTNRSFAVLIVDIDRFKYINDTFEYKIGDLLLQKFASRLKNAFNEQPFICRMDRDKFAIIFAQADYDFVHKTTSRILSLISKLPFIINEHEFFLTASIGVSIFPFTGETVEALIKNAEISMVKAKKNGRNQYQIFSSTMGIEHFRQFTLRNDARKLLANNELCIFYQPRMNPSTNELMAAEAQIRWNHPKWGTILPAEFIPIAEELGIMAPIGTWIIRNICFQLKNWQEKGIAIKKISLHLSAPQLLQPNFAETISFILEETNVDAKWLEFEIAEDVVNDKAEQIFAVSEKIKALGITFTLANFGGGYASLNNLRNFSCNTIKIAKNLVQGLDKNNDQHKIIESIITLCHRLNKIVVAEGVESNEQLTLLQKLDCDEIQGSFYSEPLDEQRFKEFLKKGKWIKKNEEVSNPIVNRRKHFRIPLSHPLVGTVTIEKIGEKKLNIGNSKVHIQNISQGGLCFRTQLRLPVRPDFFLQFKINIFSTILKVDGHIVWHKEIDEEEHEYGVEFQLSRTEKEHLLKLLNQLQIKKRQSTQFPNRQFFIK